MAVLINVTTEARDYVAFTEKETMAYTKPILHARIHDNGMLVIDKTNNGLNLGFGLFKKLKHRKLIKHIKSLMIEDSHG